MELLPGDRENLAIQTRGGPEKHEVTGWVLVSTWCTLFPNSAVCRQPLYRRCMAMDRTRRGKESLRLESVISTEGLRPPCETF